MPAEGPEPPEPCPNCGEIGTWGEYGAACNNDSIGLLNDGCPVIYYKG